MTFNPTPTFRPGTIYVSPDVSWAIKIVAAAVRGDGPAKPEYTPDGVAETLLRNSLDQSYPGLLAQYRKREAFDNEAVKLVSTKAAS